MNIVLIKTGGTISAKTENGIMIAGKSNFAEELILPCKIFSPLKKLSENFSTSDIVILAKEITAAAKEASGIIVTIGTDSLTYSSALLSFMLSGINIPVVLVSAAYPPENPKSNAKANLEGAIAFIKEGIAGVFVAYKNDGEETKIHFSSRLNASRLFDGYVSSPLNRIAAVIEKGKVRIIERVERIPFIVDVFKIKHFKTVSILPAYIGANYLVQSERSCAVICEGYHSGTVNTVEENSVNSITVPAFITGGIRGDKYESVLSIKGATAVDNIATAALYAKVLLLFSCNIEKEEINKAIFTNFAGEFFL